LTRSSATAVSSGGAGSGSSKGGSSEFPDPFRDDYTY
jgi:hypothetical protein